MSFSAEWYDRVYRNVSTSGTIAVGTGGAAGICVAPDSKHTIYVQEIDVQIHTSAPQTITFQDNAGTPVKVLNIPASAAVGSQYTVSFGPKGFALTEGKNLDISGVAGPAYAYSVRAYGRQTSAAQATTVDRTF